MNKIVAVVGMCGCGKSVATEEFIKKGFEKIYFGAVTFDILKERGMEINEANERKIREELRSSGDKGIYAKIYLPKIEEAYKKGNVVIESMYSWSEYKYVKERFGDAFKVLAIVTDSGLRRERLKNRTFRPMTAEESLSRDVSEIENVEKGGPIAIADHYITNNGSAEELIAKVNKFINNL